MEYDEQARDDDAGKEKEIRDAEEKLHTIFVSSSISLRPVINPVVLSRQGAQDSAM